MSRPLFARIRTIVLWTVPILLIAGALVAWLYRDWPRRRVEFALEAELNAEVRLGRLVIQGPRRFELHSLEVSSMASLPALDRLRIEILVVTGGPGEIMEGIIEALEVRNAEIRLAPPTRPAALPEEERPLPRIGTLTLAGSRIVAAGGGMQAALSLEGRIEDIGGRPAGRIDLASGALPVVPLIAVALGEERAAALVERSPGLGEERYRELRATLALGGPETAARLEVAAEGGGLVPSPRIEVDLGNESPEGSRLLEVRIRSEKLLSFEGSALLTGPDRPIEPLSADLAVDDLEPVIDLLASVPEGVRVAGSLSARGRADGADGFPVTVEVALPRISWPLAGTTCVARDLAVRVSGSPGPGFPPAGGRVTARLEIPLLEAMGENGELLRGLAPLYLDLDGTLEAGEEPRFEGRAVLGTTSAGRIDLDGAVVGGGEPEAALAWTWKGPGLAGLAALVEAAAAPLPLRDLSGEVTAGGTIRGDPRRPAIAGKLAVNRLRAAHDAGSLREGTASATFSLSPEGRLDLSSLTLAGMVEPAGLAPRKIDLRSSAVRPPAGDRIDFGPSNVSIQGLASLEGSGTWMEEGGNGLRAKVRVTAADAAGLEAYLLPLTGKLLPGYAWEGKPAADLEVEVRDGGGWTAKGKASVTATRFTSDDGSKVVEGLDTAWDLAVAGEGTTGPFTLEAEAKAGGFLLLWGPVFADYSMVSPRIGLKGRAEFEGEERVLHWAGYGSLRLDEGVSLSLGADAIPGHPLEATLDLEIEELGGPFERHVRAPLADSIAAFQRFQAAGRVNAKARATIGERERRLRGRVRFQDVAMEGIQGGVFVRGLDMDLPLDLRWTGADGDAPVLDGDPQRGTVRFERMALGDVGFSRTSTALAVQGDTLALEGRLNLPLLGGVLEFTDLTLADLLRPSRHAKAGIELNRVELRDLCAALDLVPLEGSVEGYFPRVRLSPTTLEVQGGGDLKVFGGTLTVGDISGSNVLTRFPRFIFSAEFAGIDLAQVTRTFDFGEMTGVLEGSVREFELFGGVPVRFEADLRTVPRKGVSQAINVKAINNIAILGTGGKIGVFDRGIHRFVDRFTYERLGLTMKLQDDVFLLRGTERRGERELFLKGKLPFRIDVVNVQPGQTVSFRAMMERVGELDFSTATTGPGKKRRRR